MLLVIFGFGFLPVAYATPDQDPFPDVSFKVFSRFIRANFGSEISLSTVLMILFSMTNNPDLLNLHARQQYTKVTGELGQHNTGWIKALAIALINQLDQAQNTLFRADEKLPQLSDNGIRNSVATKLHKLSKILDLHPYNEQGEFLGKLKSISEKDIEPVHIICPLSMECETEHCQGRTIHKLTRERDTPKVMLIKGTKIFENVPVLAGQCPNCLTNYHADHERSPGTENNPTRLYLNSAKLLKVGQQVWVDRTFSCAVLNATYNFHGSTSAFVAFWNMSFGSEQSSKKISRRHVWQAFVQESMRKVASVCGFNLELPDNLPIDEVTKQAFGILGENGIIRSANNHACSECTHDYKSEADVIPETDDPAGMIGVDENHEVPAFAGENRDDPVATIEGNTVYSTDSDDDPMDGNTSSGSHISSDSDHQVESIEMANSKVQMVVMDGIVMGPKHCAYINCTNDLVNYITGVFCADHEAMQGHLCRVQHCNNPKADGIQTCHGHRNLWHSHVVRFGRSSLLGIRRLLRRSVEERLPWLPARAPNVQPHDEEPIPGNAPKTYFAAGRFYCVETITLPCGVVIAWTKFDKAESPTNILNFLDNVFPTANSRPDYVCIDKACQVLRHAVASGRWNVWQNTTRFIVDSYHYINHRTTDYLCRKYCNPAPLNGSAPNLVVVENDKGGQPHFKRAFNTQVCIYVIFNFNFSNHLQ
jgi:CxC5 like cysteine cluster associated with KDZ transposases/CxC6 like cysteine cluster associated with KDZ transposases